MKRHRLIIVVVAVMFLLAGASLAVAEMKPRPGVSPAQRAQVEFKGGTITGTIYISDQADWNKVDCKPCSCIKVGVDTQTGTSSGQLKIPVYSDVVPAVAATGGNIAPNAKCTYKIVIPPGKTLKNIRVGAKYTGKIVPSPGSLAITSEPMSIDNPFSLMPGGSVTFDMKLVIQYIK